MEKMQIISILLRGIELLTNLLHCQKTYINCYKLSIMRQNNYKHVDRTVLKITAIYSNIDTCTVWVKGTGKTSIKSGKRSKYNLVVKHVINRNHFYCETSRAWWCRINNALLGKETTSPLSNKGRTLVVRARFKWK